MWRNRDTVTFRRSFLVGHCRLVLHEHCHLVGGGGNGGESVDSVVRRREVFGFQLGECKGRDVLEEETCLGRVWPFHLPLKWSIYSSVPGVSLSVPERRLASLSIQDKSL